MRLEKRGSMAVSLSDVISASETGSNHCPGRPAPRLIQTHWGQHLWARGYFCASVGAVDEATIRAYIENQQWDEDVRGSRSPVRASLEPALSRAP